MKFDFDRIKSRKIFQAKRFVALCVGVAALSGAGNALAGCTDRQASKVTESKEFKAYILSQRQLSMDVLSKPAKAEIDKHEAEAAKAKAALLAVAGSCSKDFDTFDAEAREITDELRYDELYFQSITVEVGVDVCSKAGECVDAKAAKPVFKETPALKSSDILGRLPKGVGGDLKGWGTNELVLTIFHKDRPDLTIKFRYELQPRGGIKVRLDEHNACRRIAKVCK